MRVFNWSLSQLNDVIVYSNVSNRYYTDGIDVYIEIKKQRGSKYHRITVNHNRIYIREICDCPGNYILLGDKLFKRLRWQVDKGGYRFLMVDVKTIPTKIAQHRLVYFHANNIEPPEGWVIDHINRNKIDNRLSNLQLVTAQENSNNVDIELVSRSHSKYKYKATHLLTKRKVIGYAKDISKEIGLSVGLVNRYAKYGYIFKSRWRIDILEEC